MRIDRSDTAVCAVCARSATGVAVRTARRGHLLWLCNDPTCITDAKNTFDMKQSEFTAREQLAAVTGGQEGGEFLAQMGFDRFSDMTEPDYREFIRRVIAGYRNALKSGMQDEPPF